MSIEKGAHGTCPTVQIKVKPCKGNEAGIVEINASDYNPAEHELVGGKKSAPKAQESAPAGAPAVPAAASKTKAPKKSTDAGSAEK